MGFIKRVWTTVTKRKPVFSQGAVDECLNAPTVLKTSLKNLVRIKSIYVVDLIQEIMSDKSLEDTGSKLQK